MTLIAILLTFGSVVLLRAAFGLDVSVVILGVALSVTLARAGAGWGIRERLLSLVFMPVVAVAAFGVGMLLVSQQVLGSALFVVAVSGAVWLRRFGPLASRIGTFIALPFVAVLITPAPVLPTAGAGFVGWAALVSLIAAGWSMLAQLVGRRAGLLSPAPEPAPQRAASAQRRMAPSTRMAIQLAVALTAAFLVGHLLLGQHWPWVVITAYVVTSGNRGRGDVAYKGVLRTVGALAGTAVATFLSGLFPAGDPAAIVWIFVALAVGLTLRTVNYAFWAASITAVLALLYGYFGEGGEQLLLNRIVGVLIGGVLAVASAWFVLPIRTGDVLRRRMFDALAVLSDVLTAARTDPERLPDEAARYRASLSAIDQLVPTLRAADVILRVRRVEQRHGHVVAALKRCAAPVEALATIDPDLLGDQSVSRHIGQVARRVGLLRRTLAGRTEPEWPDETITFTNNAADVALRDIDRVVVNWAV